METTDADRDHAPAGWATSGPRQVRDVFFVMGAITLAGALIVVAGDLLQPIILSIFLWLLINAVARALGQLPALGPVLPLWLRLAAASALTMYATLAVGQLVLTNMATLIPQLNSLGPSAAEALDALQHAFGLSFDIDLEALFLSLSPITDLGQVLSAATSVANMIGLVLLYVLFLLIDQSYFEQKLDRLFVRTDRRAAVARVLRRIAQDTRLYLLIMSAMGVGVGVTTFLVLANFGVEGALFWGFLAFALNYIPTIGSILGVALPSLFAFAQLGPSNDLIYVIGGMSLAQFIAGNVLLPRLMSDRLNLSAFVVIVSLTFWGAAWGAVGMLLAVPLMMVLTIILSQFDSTRPIAVLLSKNGGVSGGLADASRRALDARPSEGLDGAHERDEHPK